MVAALQASKRPGGRRSTILVVDDEPLQRLLLSVTLKDAGYEVREASDGTTALELVNGGGISAVLLDNRMPAMSGIEVIRALRSRPDTATLPIILVTGDDEVADRVRGLQAGANDYVVKPFNLDELVARVEAQLRGQAAWLRVVEDNLRERAAVAAALCRVSPELTPERTAEVVCQELRSLRNLDGAALISFEDDGLAVPLAIRGITAWGIQAGRPLPVELARTLQRQAAAGPWIQDHEVKAGQPLPPIALPRSSTLACGPMLQDGKLLGLLMLLVATSDQERAAALVGSALSSAIDFAAVAAELLGVAMAEQRHERSQRTTIDELLLGRAFAPVFQPIVRLSDGVAIGFEALTRFADGSKPEARFAEAASLDRGVEFESATMAAAVAALSDLPEDAFVSLNVSPDFVLHNGELRRVLAQAQRPIVLELTEHDRVDDYGELRRAITDLDMPVRLSIDDAGSGFASLRHVLALEPAFMKLDQSWVSGVHTDRARQALIAGLRHFSLETGCQLIAEGVENEPDMGTLTELGVDYAQGFYFGHPEPATSGRGS